MQLPGERRRLRSAVALLIYNRPETTTRVLEAIGRARPPRLFVVADGPHPDRPQDEERCRGAREAVEQIDWNCEVFRNYADTNLGCSYRPPTGISWVFEQVEEAIILEDDCLPDPTFFRFCDDLLERYRNDRRIMMISGRNHLGTTSSAFSYHFSFVGSCWGWATWKRAWQHYDRNIRSWSHLRSKGWLRSVLQNEAAVRYWRSVFDRTYERSDSLNTWDYQWSFACWANHGLAVTPRHNMIRNIGMGEGATHTTNPDAWQGSVAARPMEFPLRHPADVTRDADADRLLLEKLVQPRRSSSALRRWSSRFGRVIAAARKRTAGAVGWDTAKHEL